MTEHSRLPEHIDLIALTETVGGDVEVLRRLFRQIGQDLPGRLEALDRALGSGDAEALRAEAHSSKGFLASIQARRARHVAEAVDEAARRADLEEVAKRAGELHRESEDLLRALDVWQRENGEGAGTGGVRSETPA